MRITFRSTVEVHDHSGEEIERTDLERRQSIAYEVDGIGFRADLEEHTRPRGLAEPSSKPARKESARVALLRKTADGGDVPGAIDALLCVYNDPRAPLAVRADAALLISELTFKTDKDATRAELFFVRAKQLLPSIDARAMELKLLLGQGRAKEALVIVTALIAESPDDLELGAIRVRLFDQTADRPAMLSAAQELLARAKRLHAPDKKLLDYELILASACFENKQPHAAIALYRHVLASASDLAQLHSAHAGIAEILPAPEFAAQPNETALDRRGPHAAEVNHLFDQANVAYREGRYEDVRKIAEEILKLDPNDGLAHGMWATARNIETTVKKPLIPQLDSEGKRTALIGTLEERCSAARVPDGSGGTRPGRIEDLFPEWAELNEIQRAHVALSVLGYGALIPQVIEGGAKYHIAGVGTPGAFFDPDRGPDTANQFSRHYYTIRGWYDGRTDFIVTGIERLDQGARTGSSTVTHEFAHLVHRVMTRAREIPEAQRTAAQKKLAGYADRITALYADAEGKKAQFIDAYSSNNEREYFAQAMQAYSSPNGGAARRMFSSQRGLWELVAEVRKTYEAYPDVARLEAQPAIGQNAVASPLNLQALIDDPKTPRELRALAEQTFAHLEAMYAMAPMAVLGAERPPPAAGRYGRAVDLVRRAKNGDFEGALVVANDLGVEIAAGKLTEAELLETTDALAYALDRAARSAEWGLWEVIFSILTLGIVALVLCAKKADDRALRDRLKVLVKTRRPPASALRDHPDLRAIDAVGVGERRRLLLTRAEQLLRIRAGVTPAPAERKAIVGIMGFGELAAQIDYDVAMTKDPVRIARLCLLKRELTTALRDPSVVELERLRTAYLAI